MQSLSTTGSLLSSEFELKHKVDNPFGRKSFAKVKAKRSRDLMKMFRAQNSTDRMNLLCYRTLQSTAGR